MLTMICCVAGSLELSDGTDLHVMDCETMICIINMSHLMNTE